jgi:hypothetical protein
MPFKVLERKEGTKAHNASAQEGVPVPPMNINSPKVGSEAEATVKVCSATYKVEKGSWEVEFRNTRKCREELERQEKLAPNARKYTSKHIHLERAE